MTETTEFEHYLRSPAVLDDLRAILDGGGVSGPLTYGQAGKWKMVRTTEIAACWTGDGETITVSDLGYGALSYRLRTGELTTPGPMSRDQEGDLVVIRNVHRGSLAQALGWALLASYRVSLGWQPAHQAALAKE